MSAKWIYDHAPIGALIRYSDGAPRPPQRFKNKLADWENNNNVGHLVRRAPSRTIGAHVTPAGFTLHQGDFGSAGVVVLKVFKTFSVGSPLTFTIVDRPKPGMVRVLDRPGENAELLHLAADRVTAQAWLASHRYSGAILDEVVDDEAAAASGEGRAA